MKFEVQRNRIAIYLEDAQDEAFVEDTLGLKESGASIALVRRNGIASSSCAVLETRTPEQLASDAEFEAEVAADQLKADQLKAGLRAGGVASAAPL